MAQYAPETPTLEYLEETYPLSVDAMAGVASSRERISNILSARMPGLVAIIGPCAMTGATEIMDEEGLLLGDLNDYVTNVFAAHRIPPWKPRTKPTDWHGEETTDPEGAYATIARRADSSANVAIEIGHAAHLDRYGSRLAFGWSGGRNIGRNGLIEAMALHDPTLPLGIKNGLDGDIQPALQHIARINELRGPEGAPAVLIYRGGENAKTIKSWRGEYLRALDLTGGRMIVDTAHGSEIAHDPHNKKSELGQIACLGHLLELASQQNEIAAGIMIEASDAESPTDPVIPFQNALSPALHLQELRTNRISTRV